VTALQPPPSPQDLRRRLAAERLGLPFLCHRGADGELELTTLRDEITRVTIGRGEACDVRLARDPEVSRVHAELARVGDSWLVIDDGLSRNGTFLNGERVAGRQRLRDGDVIRCGATLIAFHDPSEPGRDSTHPGATTAVISLSDSQRRVLVALCRPLRDGDPYALPASNKDIADELFLSVQAVKGHLRSLFDKLGVEDLPHNQKRLRLVERAVISGLIAPRDLR
jgi:hypothetical protein